MLIRFLVVMALTILAWPVFAAEDAKAVNCEITTEIVRSAIAQRNGGDSVEGATGYLMSDEAEFMMFGDDGIDAEYDQVIPALVAWVYSLDEALATEDAAAAFEAQCLDFES